MSHKTWLIPESLSDCGHSVSLTGFFEYDRDFGIFYRIKFSSGSLILNFVMSKEGVKMVVLSSGGEKCNISE